MRDCILSNKYVKEVCVIGPSEKAFLECEKEILEKVTSISREEMKQGKSEWYEFLKRNQGIPVYVSLDKDILTVEEARTNWDQGDVSFEEEQKNGCMKYFLSVLY